MFSKTGAALPEWTKWSWLTAPAVACDWSSWGMVLEASLAPSTWFTYVLWWVFCFLLVGLLVSFWFCFLFFLWTSLDLNPCVNFRGGRSGGSSPPPSLAVGHPFNSSSDFSLFDTWYMLISFGFVAFVVFHSNFVFNFLFRDAIRAVLIISPVDYVVCSQFLLIFELQGLQEQDTDSFITVWIHITIS